MGLLTGVVSLAREPVRLTLRVWELGLSSAAEVARVGLELLDTKGSPGFDEYRAGSHPGRGANGGAPDVEAGGAAEPEVVVPETGYLAPEPGEVGPEPDVLDVEEASSAAVTPPSVPDALVPDHLDEEPVLVAEVAEEGAEDGAGPELTVEPPWDGYERMTAVEIKDRLAAASPTEAGAVELYEVTHKKRKSVLDAAERAQRA